MEAFKSKLIIHIGYGINPDVQTPTILGRHHIPVTLDSLLWRKNDY